MLALGLYFWVLDLDESRDYAVSLALDFVLRLIILSLARIA